MPSFLAWRAVDLCPQGAFAPRHPGSGSSLAKMLDSMHLQRTPTICNRVVNLNLSQSRHPPARSAWRTSSRAGSSGASLKWAMREYTSAAPK